MMNEKSKDRRILTRFILTLAVCGLAGGVAGVLISRSEGGLAALLDSLNYWLSTLSPWLMLAAFLLCTAVAVLFSRRAKKLLAADAADDEAFARADRLLGTAMAGTGLYVVVSIVLFVMAMSNVSSLQPIPSNLITATGVTAFFLVSVLFSIFLQTRLVRQVKQANPTKRGNALDHRFEKDWLESSDEAEKLIIYRAAYSAFRAGKKLYPCMTVALLLLNLVTPTGVLPILIIGILWMTETVAYLRASIRASRETIS